MCVEVCEDCVSLYATEITNSDQISLSLSRCYGQCYDRAVNISGKHSGVATQIQMEEPRALYLHCMGHSFNLAVQDTY